jgi:hypothetical protein
MFDNNSSGKKERVITFLNRDEVDFLDKLGKDALFSLGTKVSRAKLIAWMVDMAKGLGLDGQNLKSEEDLEARIVELIKLKESQGT